jgi:hypothetical protein
MEYSAQDITRSPKDAHPHFQLMCGNACAEESVIRKKLVVEKFGDKA